jgi:hypothetical protein
MVEPYKPPPFGGDREPLAKGPAIPAMRPPATELDPSDPFEAALIPIVQTNRRKRADYALDGDPFSNFRGTAAFIGQPVWMSPLFNCAQKLERIKSLSANGRLNDPKNEAIEDTILDNAVYGVIAWAIYHEEK